MRLNTTSVDVVMPGQLGAPLPRSELEARIAQKAADGGLVLRPVFYSLPFTSASRIAEAKVTPTTEDGPLIITRVFVPEALSSQDYLVKVKAGTRDITTGRVRGNDAFRVPADQLGAALPAPILLSLKETLSVEATLPSADVVVGDGFLVYGFHLNGPNAERLPYEPGGGGVAEAFIDELGREGQLWIVGVATSASSASLRVENGVNVQRDCIVERLVVDVDDAEEGEVEVASIRLSIGNVDLFPQGLSGGVLRAVRRPTVIEGARWPVSGAARTVLTVQPAAGAGDPALARVTLIGRAPRSS